MGLFEDFRIYTRNLPHWRAEGAVYFVTFRLADSIPQTRLDEWRGERDTWLAEHGLGMKLSPAEWRRRYEAIPQAQRVAFQRAEARKFFRELDLGHGACELRHPEAAETVARTLNFYHGTRLRCGNFVIMPNHVHWLVQPLAEEALETLLQSVKQFSCKRVNACCHRRGTLWQKESYDHIVRNAAELARIQKYINDNPDKARLRPGEFLYYKGDTFETVGPISQSDIGQ